MGTEYGGSGSALFFAEQGWFLRYSVARRALAANSALHSEKFQWRLALLRSPEK
jgi:hypothetical protein